MKSFGRQKLQSCFIRSLDMKIRVSQWEIPRGKDDWESYFTQGCLFLHVRIFVLLILHWHKITSLWYLNNKVYHAHDLLEALRIKTTKMCPKFNLFWSDKKKTAAGSEIWMEGVFSRNGEAQEVTLQLYMSGSSQRTWESAILSTYLRWGLKLFNLNIKGKRNPTDPYLGGRQMYICKPGIHFHSLPLLF